MCVHTLQNVCVSGCWYTISESHLYLRVVVSAVAGVRDATGVATANNAAYFAVARDTETDDLGHGWTFAKLTGLVPSYTQWPVATSHVWMTRIWRVAQPMKISQRGLCTSVCSLPLTP
jgi:hypothetical protein